MSNILKYQNPSSPLLNPHKIIKNVPAREWGPIKINEDDAVIEGEGTSFLLAPFQYWGNKGLGLQNEKLARDLVSEFDQMRSKNPDYNYILDKNYPLYDDAINYLNHLEALKKYLHLPYDTGLLMESKYKPTRLQGTNEKTYKFRSSTVPGYWNDVVEDMVMGEHSKNQYSDQSLNEFTAYRDRDEKGDFVSIYDEWDYNPAVRGGNKKLNKVIDSVTGGKPFVIYDRVYLDDYYDIPEEARGNPFITPAVVTAYKKGGSIHIKKKNRGKFTDAAKRAGMGVQEFAKHENGGILKAQDGTSKTFWQKLTDSLKENGLAARDARIGAIGAQQVRDLYAEGKNQENQTLSGETPTNGGELEPAIVKPAPVYGFLDTYYPLVSEYPFTGHSELQIADFGWNKPITITKYGTDYDYNLVTNNCSDATRCAVEQIFGKEVNPILFTTPGDVQDFVSEQTGKTPYKSGRGVTTIDFEIPFATAMDLNNQDLDFYIQDFLHKRELVKKQLIKENPNWDSSGFDASTAEVVKRYEDQKYKFQPFIEGYEIDEKGNYIKARGGGRILSGEKEQALSGKFTKYCGGKVTEECIRKGKNSSNPIIRKGDTFAANVRKRKHENGGILKYQNPSGTIPSENSTGYHQPVNLSFDPNNSILNNSLHMFWTPDNIDSKNSPQIETQVSTLPEDEAERVQYWMDKFKSFGLTTNQQLALVAAMKPECGLKPQGSVNDHELTKGGGTKGGWAHAGEGTVHITHWDTKKKFIDLYNADSRRQGSELSNIEADYADPNARHIADLSDDDHALFTYLYYKPILDRTKNVSFKDLIAEFYLQKAGRGFATGATPYDQAVATGEYYQKAHAKQGHLNAAKINKFIRMLNYAINLAKQHGITIR